MAACPPRGLYRDRIRTVAVTGAQIRSTLSSHSQSGQSGSSCSGDSGDSVSYNNSGSPSHSPSAVATDFGAHGHELAMVARQMVSDGYTQCIIQAFHVASPAPAFGFGGPDRALEDWFFELDVDWVLQIHSEHGLFQQLQLQDKSPAWLRPASWLQDLVERWIRALTVTAFSVQAMVITAHQMPAVARFVKASIAKMLIFVDVIARVLRVENLRAVLDMFACVSNASYMFTPVVISPEAQSIFSEIGGSLERQGDRLYEVLSSMMEEVRTPMEEDDTWAIEILRGGGGVHRNTRLMVDYITSMREACASTQNCAPSNNTVNLGDLIDDTIEYLEDLLLRKSELCSDPSLRYIFLLNNSHFVAQVSEPSVSLYLEQRSELNLTPECKKFMDSYLDVSWGHVLSCIPKSRFPGPIHCWINTSSLAKFESAFQKTYRAQKFWKVPDPRLRDVLRRAIAERVISGYGDYLEEHPELEKHIGRESSSPEVFKKMLGELFEG
ncbi:hypothetical protein CFC21_032582 [Triticum aestivum]|uniref:Exocyst subunit Exo70 family protein n=2 Tax=Triticum aestivum TaxID=4565 RepID=A0A3B6DLF4_WHEAT|nr:exocyst complex component EXO70B1-like [Triticum aestivum]KAF7019406.1 hypothetical protein CFC21_032582 [Triticum aestivum]